MERSLESLLGDMSLSYSPLILKITLGNFYMFFYIVAFVEIVILNLQRTIQEI